MATIPEVLAMAIQHHLSGRLQAAEQMYREILQSEPNHADALHLLGMIAYQVGNHPVALEYIHRSIQLDGTAANVHNNLGGVYRALHKLPEAVACYRRAVELKPGYADAYVNLGNVLIDQGILDQAITSYRRALELKPNFVDAHINLGNALKALGHWDEALACFQRILELQPDNLETRINLGNALKDQGKLDEAVACYRHTLELQPDFAIAHLNLGVVLKAQGKADEAIACYHRVLQLQPDFPEAHNNLGNALKDQGKLDDAIVCYRRAIELKPDLGDAYNNLGNALYDQGKLDEAVPCYRRALEIQPAFPKALCNLGVVLQAQGKLDEAVACYRRTLELAPSFADAHSYLGTALKSQGKLDEAIAHCQRAIELQPNDPGAYNHLGNTLKDQGRLDEAIGCYRRAVELKPDLASVHSNLVYTQVFCPGYDGQALLQELSRWNEFHAQPLAKFIQPHLNNRSVNRRLRIGYVSPDFRNHVVGRNLLPLFREHDHQQFEVFCYADVPHHDELTLRFQGYADIWRNTKGLNDAQLTQCIRDDQIDILVDLTLHMAQNRLLVFARKPAPVQVTFAGYPGTTGLTTIDYRLTDPYLDPPGQHDQDYSEESVRLPDSFWCYDPLDSDTVINALPAAEQGMSAFNVPTLARRASEGSSRNLPITFGCLNNFCKVNANVLKIWAQVLRAVEGSRLMMLAGEGSHRRHTLNILATDGIEGDRVSFVTNQPRAQYLKTYHRIDIGLDTIPYNGHSTSLDSFWMGVPVVTLVGPTVVGRAGLCQLMNLGLPELIADSPARFVSIAVELAKDLPRLNLLRATLRERIQASPLMDQLRFARNIETAYRQMWWRWCLQ